MMNIDENYLLRDLYYTRNEFILRPNKRMIKADYDGFSILNDVLGNLTGKMFPIEKIFKGETQKQTIKNLNNEINEYIKVSDENEKLILKTFKNYSHYLKTIKFIYPKNLISKKCFSEKDYKDIILSYYSTFGDRIYNMVKKYFDEDRIHLGYVPGPFEMDDTSAFYAFLTWLERGYIINTFDDYSSSSLVALTHEFGHAIDAESFVFPQQKILETLPDLLLEVPSTTFEFGMYDYLKRNKIDEEGALIHYNYTFNMLNKAYGVLKECYDCKDGIVNQLGELLKPEQIIIDKNNVQTDEEGNIILKTQKNYRIDSVYEYDENNYIVNMFKKLPFRSEIIYGLGYLFALHLNLIKDSSMKEFKKTINNICTSRRESTLEQSIEMLGVSVDDFINQRFIRDKIKGETKELKKKFKIY